MPEVKLKPVEIKIPKVPEVKLLEKPILPEKPLLPSIPEAIPGVVGAEGYAQGGKLMKITPDLASSMGVKYFDLAVANPRLIQHDQMLRTPVPKPLMVAMAFLGLGPLLFLNPHVYSWISEHLSTFLGMLGLPFFGMVFGGGGEKPPSNPDPGSSFSFRGDDGHSYQIRRPQDIRGSFSGLYRGEYIFGRKTEHRYLENGKVEVTFDMFDTEVDFRRARGNREVKFEVSVGEFLIMGFEQKFPSYYIITPDTPVSTTPFTLDFASGDEGSGFVLKNEGGEVVLTINTQDGWTAERIQLQVLESYERTGSLSLALDELHQMPWDPNLFSRVTPASELAEPMGIFDVPSGPPEISAVSAKGELHQIVAFSLADRVYPGTTLLYVKDPSHIVLSPDGRISVTFHTMLTNDEISFTLPPTDAAKLGIRPGELPPTNFFLR